MTDNTADAVLEMLADRQVSHLFGLPGSTEGAMLDALSRRTGGPEFVLCLHEGAAAAMADGYGRVSGAPGVCVVHTTVGSGNAISQLYNSKVDNVPVLCIVGHKDTSLYNSGGFCTTGYLPAWFEGCAKHATQVNRAVDAVDDVERQLLRASANPPGPTVAVVPQDHWEQPGSPARALRGVAAGVPAAGRPDAEQLRRMCDRLRGAARPVVLAGDWVYREDAEELVVRFAEAYGARIVGEPRRSASRRGSLRASELYLGDYEDRQADVAEADVVVALGARTFVEFERAAPEPAIAPEVLISVHPSAAEVLARTPGSLSIAASVRSTLQDALDLAGAPAGAAPAPAAEARGADRWSADDALTASTIGTVLDGRLPQDAIVFDEAVTSSPPLMRELSIGPGREYHRNTGGALGWGIPAAIGAQFAAPDRPVVSLLGDGSAMFGIHGLWTAARWQMPVLTIVVNNGGYGSVVGAVGRFRGGAPGVPVPGVAFDQVGIDFIALSASLGVDAVRADSLQALAAAVDKWSGNRTPLLIECPVAAPKGMR
jgi:benzoylformate decarboxylase